MFPRPRGADTKVIVTEYELPQVAAGACMMSQGDSKGMMWFSSHKTDVVGKLDPKTGIVTEYTIPLTPKAMPGTHAVRIDKNDIPWFSENWGHNLDRLDPQTGKVTQVKIEDAVPLNAPGFRQFFHDARMVTSGTAATLMCEKSIRKPAKWSSAIRCR